MQRIGDLELDQDLAFERRQWHVQRVAWVLMLLFLAAACTGVFGLGPWSSGQVASGDGTLVVDYERFVRRQMDQDIVLSVTAAQGDTVVVWLDDSALVVEAVWPEPEQMRAENGRQEFVFSTEEGASLEVRFAVTREDMGRETIAMGIEGYGGVSFWQVSYP